MSKGSATPPAPNFTAGAEQTAAGNKEALTQQTWANRPDQNTPWGSSFWTTGQQTDPATGQPVTTWTQNETLDPSLQGALDQQLQMQGDRTNLASGFMGRVGEAYQQPFDWQNLPGMSGTPNAQFTQGRNMATNLSPTTGTTNEAAFGGERQRIEQGLFDRMAPQHQQQEAQTRTMLANQGLTPGSEAYNAELQRLGDQQSRERFNAMEMGGSEQARMQQMLLGQQQQAFGQQGAAGQFYNQGQQQMFGQDLGANAQNFSQMNQQADYQNRMRQQAIAEQAMARGMPLNEMNAMMSGQQVSMPGMPAFMGSGMAQAPNYMGAQQAQYGAGLDAYNAQQAQQTGLQNGLFGLGSSALMAYGLGGGFK
jgi:hypothetical protein